MCPKSSQLAAAMSLIFCVDLGCTWDGHGWPWKHIQFAVTPWLLPFPIIWRAKNITSASFTATIQENEAKWHMSFLTFCFQIKITPKRWRQLCRLILSKRQIKVWGFQKCNQKIFLAHWYVFKLPTKTTLRNFPDRGSKWNSYFSKTPLRRLHTVGFRFIDNEWSIY